MPAYWFMYNMYALARNFGKYVDRDKRLEQFQRIEYDFLAPDSINEIFTALTLLKKFTALSQQKNPGTDSEKDLIQEGEKLLETQANGIKNITIYQSGFENNSRPVCIAKVNEAYRIYKDLIVFYGIMNIINFVESQSIKTFDQLTKMLPGNPQRLEWTNIGGQLLPMNSLNNLLQSIKDDSIKSWNEVHLFYQENGSLYDEQKLQHAYASVLELMGMERLDGGCFKSLLVRALNVKDWMMKNIYDSRAKDFQSEFRKMVYENENEMGAVMGTLDENVFINQQKEELISFKKSVERIIDQFKL
jgi:hypothetical protein